jgi:hypothetical protein
MHSADRMTFYLRALRQAYNSFKVWLVGSCNIGSLCSSPVHACLSYVFWAGLNLRILRPSTKLRCYMILFIFTYIQVNVFGSCGKCKVH